VPVPTRLTSALRHVNGLLSGVSELVLKCRCAVCGDMTRGEAVCGRCTSRFRLITEQCCARCGRPLAAEGVAELCDGFLCGDCRLDKPKLHFDRAVSVFVYEGEMRTAILKHKHGKRVGVGKVLGKLWGTQLPVKIEGLLRQDERPDLILPVPLHESRLREREFNQSAILARHASSALGVRAEYEVLSRIRATEYQSRLTPAQKRQNVKGAFAVTRPEPVRGAAVLLVDDIFTTGSTVNECAKALKKAGARSVTVATLARPTELQQGDLPDDTRPDFLETAL